MTYTITSHAHLAVPIVSLLHLSVCMSVYASVMEAENNVFFIVSPNESSAT